MVAINTFTGKAAAAVKTKARRRQEEGLTRLKLRSHPGLILAQNINSSAVNEASRYILKDPRFAGIH